ncbi:VCBS repeat-containing protein [Marinilongibacter aquaticus]|nr:VCBS repeat-containing protein [Marinilongibacter aquaticus]UBM61035.1 VCBS repeat-containing protein [Marinilongibacter aquaticus]
MAFGFIGLVLACQAQDDDVKFKKIKLEEEFVSEGVAVADLNHDGLKDIVAGYFWYEAPNWTRHNFAPSPTFDPRKEYSNSFLNFGMDVNLDGWDDVVIIDFPGKPAFWFENPKGENVEQWQTHIIADSVGVSNESPAFIDINGDGRLDILCGDMEKKQIVWLEAPKRKGDTQWLRHPLSAENVPGTERFSHGIGWGDINGDGKKDVVVADAWFENNGDLDGGNWVCHQTMISEPCSHMQVLDLDGDGLNDVISASAHRLGIWYHKQKKDKGEISFETQLISGITAQTHSSIMADLNNDGQDEFITGKRFLAHNGNDAGDADTPYLLYFSFDEGGQPMWNEHIIDNDSGAGLNITVDDMDEDGRKDLIISNKNGVFLFLNEG